MKTPVLSYVFFFLLFSFSLIAQPPTAEAGAYRKICPGSGNVGLGGTPTATGGLAPYTYKWQPGAVLNDSTISQPVASVTVTTTFTVTVTGANNESDKDTVTIYVYPYSINAGPDTTIKSGQTITLHGTANGANQVSWLPSGYYIYNQTSFNPDVFPPVTTVYTLNAYWQAGGCTLYDPLTVTVEATTELFFYNTFSPNGDFVNDYWVIGNIEKYPDNVLEIYNRYGQKVFTKTGYKNDWDGKYLNNELPSGTYFYILDTRDEKGGKYNGAVTIVK